MAAVSSVLFTRTDERPDAPLGWVGTPGGPGRVLGSAGLKAEDSSAPPPPSLNAPSSLMVGFGTWLGFCRGD